jgi:predicted secreted hydrolase
MSFPLSTIQRRSSWALKITAAAVFLVVNLQADPPSPPDPWQRAIEPWSWTFPRDHGAHPHFKTEWWYFTGNLQEAQGGASARKFGYQLTLFRQGIQFTPAQPSSNWAVRDLYFGHFTISDLTWPKK